MKIERLYKLNQFVDFTKEIEQKENETYTKFIATKLGLIIRYNERLKQSVMKEMVVNNESKDWFNKDGSINVKIQLNWMEAEKKIIFTAETINEDLYQLEDGTLVDFHNDKCLVYETLYDLAEETNGQLKVKNISL